jgi:CRP/FNR family transcriptional regulator, cyclic AMP receptor protein
MQGYEPQPASVPAVAFTSGSARLFDVLAARGKRRRYPVGRWVVREGDAGSSLFLVHSGALRACMAASPARLIELNPLSAGDIFGELCLGLDRRTATVEVLSAAQLTEVAREDALDALQQHPELAVQLVHLLIVRLGLLMQRMRGLVSMDVYGRMVDLFASLAETENGRAVLPRLTQQAIGEHIGASRSMVNRLLKGLSQAGYLTVEADRMVLLRPLPQQW